MGVIMRNDPQRTDVNDMDDINEKELEDLRQKIRDIEKEKSNARQQCIEKIEMINRNIEKKKKKEDKEKKKLNELVKKHEVEVKEMEIRRNMLEQEAMRMKLRQDKDMVDINTCLLYTSPSPRAS